MEVFQNLEHRQKFKDAIQKMLDNIDEMYADNFRIGDLRKLLDYEPSVLLTDMDKIDQIIDVMKNVGMNTSRIRILYEKAKTEKETEGDVQAIKIQRIQKSLQDKSKH